MIELHRKKFQAFISEEEIAEAVLKMAKEIDSEYAGKSDVHFLPILNGAFVFCADLSRKISINPEISFVKVKSYSGTQSTGDVKSIIGINANEIHDKDILIVEDIVDTGHTINYLKKDLIEKGAKSVSVACLIFKPKAYQYKELPEFIGINIENFFIVGYGMDYDELGRNLPAIYREE